MAIRVSSTLFFVLFLIIFSTNAVFAGGIYLYEGNNGTQDLVGALSDESKKNKIKTEFKKDDHLQNDEVRSVVLKHVAPGTVIKLYDDPKGDKGHDWVKIEVKKDSDEIVIGTLEKSKDKDDYRIDYHNTNHLGHLDGKVSCIIVYPDKPLPSSGGITAPQISVISETFRQQSPGMSIFLEAERILANIETTAYSHRSSVDDISGRYLMDCSGLLSYILKWPLPLPSHYEGMMKLAEQENHKRPLASTVYNYITSDTPRGWKQIDYLRNTKPGDIIVHRYSEGHGGRSTGHVIIVAGLRKKVGKVGHNGKDYWEYRVPIIDSARGSHSYDSRNSGAYNAWPAVDYTGTKKTGVGKGFVFFGVNKKGSICYEKWDKNRSPKFKGDFVIGRAVPIEQK